MGLTKHMFDRAIDPTKGLRPSKRGLVLGLLAILLALVPKDALAQGGPSTFRFSFSNPGARSLGFAGAFAALADDATAAFANPAGLVQLTRPEVSLEGRYWSYSTPFTEGGRVSGEPSGILLDTIAGLRTARSEADLSDLSFLSYVYPRGDWSLAFYRHVLANFESVRATQGFFVDDPVTPRADDFRSFLDMEIVTYSVAGAYRVSEDFSLGIGLSHPDPSILLRNETFGPFAVTLPEGTFGTNVFDPRAIVESGTLESAAGEDILLTAGFLWKVSEHFNLGGFFRQGPQFDVEFTLRSPVEAEPSVEAGQLKLPNTFGVGIAFKSDDRLTISFEWDRVEYSTIVESSGVSEGIELDDGSEIRLGAEYVFLKVEPVIAIRGGVWLDPDHQIRFVGPNALTRAAFPGGDDEVHFAVGLGLAFQVFQIDFAVDLSRPVDTASLSAIYTF